MSASALAVFIVKALEIVLALIAELDLTGYMWPPERNVANGTCFDYIVIGVGTAGSVIVNRLSENPNFTVLGIEAGGNPQIEHLVPSLFFAIPNSYADWAFRGTYDPFASSSQDNHAVLQAGKVVGGSSTINHFIEARGAIADYDNWAEILHDKTWEYKNVLPYFKKSERLEYPPIAESRFAPYHGYDGLQGVSVEPREAAQIYLQSFNETGSNVLIDLNADINVGVTQTQVVVTESERQSSAVAFIRPIRNRPNFVLLRHTLATRIIFDGKRAVAVEVIRNKKKAIYRACKEIILSAGVYNSPQILMLSGIGHKSHLESFNIDVKADLPVGDNYQDQVAVSLVYRTSTALEIPFVPLNMVPFPIILDLAALNPNQTFADYQVFALVYENLVNTLFIPLTCAIIFPYRFKICDSFTDKNLGHNTLYNLITYTKPHSRGHVRLANANPSTKVLITPGYYQDKTDIVNMRKFIRDFRKIENSTFFKKVGAQWIDPDLVDCNKYKLDSDDFWDCYILRTSVSVYHTSSTCAMGIVTDSRFRVKKVTNLRVVDASAMPHLISGSPNAVVVMMAEKASDFIKEDAHKYNCSDNCKSESETNESGGFFGFLQSLFGGKN